VSNVNIGVFYAVGTAFLSIVQIYFVL